MREEVGFIAPVEGLRGIAVLWVLAFHYLVVREAPFPADPWIRMVAGNPVANISIHHGYLGVDLFFLITGFLLTLPWFRQAAEGRPAPGAREFYRRRAFRILPAYYVQLLFLFLVCVPLLRDLTYWKSDLAYYLVNFGAHVTMLHYTTPITSASLSLNGALWTLALEAQYYLLLPLLAPLFVRAAWPTAAALFGAAMAWHWAAMNDLAPLVAFEMAIGAAWSLPESTIRHLIGTQLPAYFAHFAVGIMAGRAWLAWRGRAPSTPANVGGLVAAAVAVFVLYRMHAPGGVWLGDFNWVLIPIAMGVVMLALVSTGNPLARPLLANAPLAFVGRISYSVYLYHLPLLLLWNKFAPKDLGWLSLPIYVAIVLGVAWLSWRFVELRYIGLRKQMALKTQMAADGAQMDVRQD